MIKNKSGFTHELFFNVFELVLALVVALALFQFINNVVKSTEFEKNYLARDLSLMVNTVYSSPGDVSYTYGENLGGNSFSIKLEPNSVIVREKDSEVPIFYNFAENNNILFSYNGFQTDKDKISLMFNKLNGQIIVETSPSVFTPAGGLSGGAGRTG